MSFIAVAAPAFACSAHLTLTDPTEAVSVRDLATVGSVYEVLACTFESVTAGFGENEPPSPSVKLTDAPGTRFPKASLALMTMGKGRVFPTVPICFDPETTDIAATGPMMPFSVNVADE